MKSHQKMVKASLTKIVTRSLPQGGFSTYNGGIHPDATAWAALALEEGEWDGNFLILHVEDCPAVKIQTAAFR